MAPYTRFLTPSVHVEFVYEKGSLCVVVDSRTPDTVGAARRPVIYIRMYFTRNPPASRSATNPKKKTPAGHA